MAYTQNTTVHLAEIVRYDDPLLVTERVAVAAFLAGYTGATRRSYTTDLRIFGEWCHDSGFNLLGVRRPHLETFARWMEQQGRMPSTIGRRLSTLSSFYKYCQLEDILDKNPAANIRRSTLSPAPWAWTATNWVRCSYVITCRADASVLCRGLRCDVSRSQKTCGCQTPRMYLAGSDSSRNSYVSCRGSASGQCRRR